jgi:hypothetical protein
VFSRVSTIEESQLELEMVNKRSLESALSLRNIRD